jgi:hypothetical protein
MGTIFKVIGAIVVAIFAIGVIASLFSHKSSPPAATNTGTTGNTGTIAVTTTIPTYPNGEPGNQDFAVASLQEQGQIDNSIGGTIRITNVGSQTEDMGFTVTFFPTSAETGAPLGSASGSALAVAPGQTVTEDLISTDAQFSQSTYYYQFQVNFENASS